MRIALVLLLGLAMAGAAYLLLTKGEDAPRNPISYSPTEYDFGRVRVGEVRDLQLTLTNTTGRQVRVICKTNCSCVTLGQGATGSMDPGETKHVFVRVKPTHPLSIAGKKLQIFTDHPDQRYAEVPFKGVIVAPFLVKPYPVRLGSIDSEEALRGPHVARIEPGEGFSISIKKLQSDLTGLFLATAEANEDGTITVTSTLAKGKRPLQSRVDISHRIYLRVQEGKEPPIDITASVRIAGMWRGPK